MKRPWCKQATLPNTFLNLIFLIWIVFQSTLISYCFAFSCFSFDSSSYFPLLLTGQLTSLFPHKAALSSVMFFIFLVSFSRKENLTMNIAFSHTFVLALVSNYKPSRSHEMEGNAQFHNPNIILRTSRKFEWMNVCVFIYRTFHILSQGGLQF